MAILEGGTRMQPQLFLDTEWANDATRELVSLAITNADGSLTFYAERDPLPAAPSTFVARVVYPLLERGQAAVPDAEFGSALRNFISTFNSPIVHFDALLDRTLLLRALTGFGQLNERDIDFQTMLVTRQDVLDRLDDYFSTHPEQNLRRHHAGVDAEALRWAFVGADGWSG
jgi:hypothetical protein